MGASATFGVVEGRGRRCPLLCGSLRSGESLVVLVQVVDGEPARQPRRGLGHQLECDVAVEFGPGGGRDLGDGKYWLESD